MPISALSLSSCRAAVPRAAAAPSSASASAPAAPLVARLSSSGSPLRCGWTESRTSAALRTARKSLRPSSLARRSIVVAGWGDDIQFSEASVLEVSKASASISSLLIDVGEISNGYVKAGQFVQAKVGDSKAGFFAIASAPSTDNNTQGTLQLLIKESGETAELLCKLAPGDKLEVSPVMGKGFPVENIDGCSEVYIFATGSGISPIKALIESGTLKADTRDEVTLYFGASNSEAMACQGLFNSWKELGVTVVPVLSSDGKGYVQDIFASAGKVIKKDSAAAILCGQKEMAMAIKAAMETAGVPEERVLTNF